LFLKPTISSASNARNTFLDTSSILNATKKVAKDHSARNVTPMVSNMNTPLREEERNIKVKTQKNLLAMSGLAAMSEFGNTPKLMPTGPWMLWLKL
jgi:hypothetical protein